MHAEILVKKKKALLDVLLFPRYNTIYGIFFFVFFFRKLELMVLIIVAC